MAPTAPQRLATAADEQAITALMRDSIRALFPRYYDERQTASAVVHVGRLDMRLIEDGTYFVHEAGGGIVAGRAARSGRAGGGAGATSCSAGAATRVTTTGCSTRQPSRRGSARCSCAPTG